MTTEAASDLDLFELETTGQPNKSADAGTIPDKYKGKSVEDLIKMHQNAEHLISRQGTEVAQVRRMADAILDLKKPTTGETTTVARHEPVTVQALLNNPEKALRSAVDSSDLAKRATNAEARVDALEVTLAEQAFVGKHGDFATEMNDPSFKEWLNKSPVRIALVNAAAAKNFKAANDLFDLWDEHKELTGAAGTAGEAETIVPDAGKAKTVPSGVKSAPAQIRGKPIYSRLKVMDLKAKALRGDQAAIARLKDPVFEANLNKAYADGRVR